MAQKDMTIAEQLKRAACALEQIDSGTSAAPAKGESSPATSPAPVGSLSAALLRSDGLLGYGDS